MKKLINKPEDVVKQSLAGVAAAHADLVKVAYDPDIVVRADAPVQGKVGIISGGGSGHEPMHGGFVGMGMLDAACPGDVMNFEMAAELCQAEGANVEAVVIDDDVAVQDSLYTAGRRGVGTTVLAEKICGASAERGDDLKTVADLCRKVNANGRSMGMALTSCTVPAAGKPTFDIGDDEMEIGIGIHGEPGRQRLGLKSAEEIVGSMAEAVISDLPFGSGDQVIAMVNGMGGTPLIELYLVYDELVKICEGKGITIARRLVGNYITSLEMAGCSITLVKADDELLELWDAPVHTPALRWGV